jgi:predicted secreted acid phosphatase
MNKFTSIFLLLALILSPTITSAKELVNLAIVKKQLAAYHDSGEYMQDINTVDNKAVEYLKTRLRHLLPSGKKLAIILDIDETSLSNYADMVRLGFGGTLEEIRQGEDKGIDSAIEPTLKLYRFAKLHHVAVFFLTGRREFERQATINNLRQAGYENWDGLILRSTEYDRSPTAAYKTAMRKKLTEEGYDIILSVGDQNSDLTGGYADKTFKLPNPYYFIP